MSEDALNTDIAVTVVCTCYNQASYIRDALEGFIAQKTSFPYEVIVHDDASTDGTSEIILEYAKRFPKLIIPVIQTENKVSQGIGIYKDYISPLVHGRYIAKCEGDDYWIDENKLQKQFDFLENNKDYTMVVHNAYVIDYAANIVYLSEKSDYDKDKTMEDIIHEGGGLLNPTASFFYRVNAKKIDCSNFNAPVGDHFMMMSLVAGSKLRWMSEPMSVYRYGAVNSFTGRVRAGNKESIERYKQRYISALKSMDEATSYLYHDSFVAREKYQETEADERILILEFAGNGKLSLIKGLSLKLKIKALAARLLPSKGYDWVRRIFFVAKKRKAQTLVYAKATKINALQVNGETTNV